MGGSQCRPGMRGCPAFCEDGSSKAPEECDDGNTVNTDDCTNQCKLARCGDGVVWAGHEQCDDGNTASGDGCSGRCTWEPKALAGGYDFDCALGFNGSVKCWGANSQGQLGLGDTQSRGDQAGQMGDNLPAVDLGTGRTATQLAASNVGRSACAILDDGTVKCWGNNLLGTLGLGDAQNRGDQPGEMGDNLPTISLGTGRTAKAIAKGSLSTCALLDNGTVRCWGHNDHGQLGLGDTNSRGAALGQMGDNLPAVDLGTGRTAQAIVAGDESTCALLDDGTVKCWGFNAVYNGHTGLGLGDTENRGDGPAQMGDNLPAVDFGTGRKARMLAAGDESICALLDNGALKCWGSNSRGGLGLGDTASRGGQPGQMGDNLPAVDLGTGHTAKSIAGGNYWSRALLENGAIKCWGYNFSGELGLGDDNSRGNQPGQMGDNLPTVNLGTMRTARALSVTGGTTCALLDDGTCKCWGDNEFGQLGLGDTNNRGDQPNEMGDNLPVVELTF